MKILLFSDNQRIFDVTNKIISDKYELIWKTYDFLDKNDYPIMDVVIMHFDKRLLERGTFEPIIKVKGRMGHTTPILAIMESDTPQDIILTLEAGAFDYLETVQNLAKYEQKIEEMIQWKWYLEKYSAEPVI